MSCGSDFDGPDFTDETVRRARKPHRCCACGETIPTGHRYQVTAGKWDGRIDSFKHCLRCAVLLERLGVALDDAGEEGPQLDLDCGHEWEEVFLAPPPEDIAALAFLTPDEAQALLARAA